MSTIQRAARASLLVSRFFSSLGYFGLFSVLALLFLEKPFAFSTAQVAFLLGVFGFSGHGFAILWSFIPLRLNLREASLYGLGTSALALFVLAATSNFFATLISLIIFCIGLSLTQLTARMWVSSLPDTTQRTKMFGELYRWLNLSAGIAPIVVFALPYHTHPRSIIMLAAALYIIAALIIAGWFPVDAPITTKTVAWRHMLPELKKDFTGNFALIIGYTALIGAIFALTQSGLLPVYFRFHSAVPSIMGGILAINPFMIVLFQNSASRIFFWCHKKLNWSGFALGMLSCTLGFLAFSFSSNLIAVCAFVILVTFGEMLVFPYIDLALSEAANPALKMLHFSVTGFLGSIMRGLSESGGISTLSFLNTQHLPLNLWWAFGAVLMMGFLLILRSLMRKNSTTSNHRDSAGSHQLDQTAPA